MTNSPPIRVVTGHDPNGKAVITLKGHVDNVITFEEAGGHVLYEIWRTGAAPSVIDNGSDPTLGATTLHPVAGGTVCRIVDFPPDPDLDPVEHAERLKSAFRHLGDENAHLASKDGKASPHPFMHRTETVDYGMVLEGEIVLVLDDSETVLGPGSIVVQRGTSHAWANKSDRLCRMLFILIDAKFDPAIAEAHAKQ